MSNWTRVLLSTGLISLPAAVSADDAAPAPAAPAAPPPTVLTALSATTLSGYVDTSAVWKFGTGNANMPGRVYDGSDVQDGFNLNVVSLTLNKPLDDSLWAAGYNIQMLMGPGAHKRGSGLVFGGTTTEFSFNEAYINLRVPVGNGIELHVGQFGTFNGYEAYDTYKDPNWSRSYGFYIESSAHTGVAATYKFNDIFTLMGGVGNAAGFNNQVDARQSIESKKSYLVMGTLTAPESLGFLKGGSLSVGYTVGDHQLDASGNSSLGTPAGGARWNQGNLYIGGSIPTPLAGLSLGVAYDYTHGQNFKSDYANATALYFLYQATEKLKINLRADYAWGSSGAFGYAAPLGTGDELFAFTSTLDYSLWKNVISRLEFRWDHALSGGKPFGGTVGGLGSGASDKNSFSLAANFIYQF